MSSTYQNLFLSTLSKAKKGRLSITLPDGSNRHFGDSLEKPIVVKVADQTFFKDIILGQDIGLGESFMEGKWETSDLTGFLKFLINNRGEFSKSKLSAFAGIGRNLLQLSERVQHQFRSNTKKQSRKNIHSHYDLGNDFYDQFLDPSMTYSSAFFTEKNQNLEEAQAEKYDRICRKLALGPGVHLLEIGSGWGGFAAHAAQHYGCRVTSVTISTEQFAFAKTKFETLGLKDRIDIHFKDYRDIKGRFDRIASIEMLEAVGHEHLKSYFSQCSKLLKPDGLMAIQVILSPDSRYRYYQGRSDFIRKHIFPGGHLPSIKSIHDTVNKCSDWDLYHYESFGTHYAETLRRWRDDFNDTRERRASLGFDEVFDRKWNFYFSYCEAGFDTRHIQVGQFVFGSPNNSSYTFESESPRENTVKKLAALID